MNAYRYMYKQTAAATNNIIRLVARYIELVKDIESQKNFVVQIKNLLLFVFTTCSIIVSC